MSIQHLRESLPSRETESDQSTWWYGRRVNRAGHYPWALLGLILGLSACASPVRMRLGDTAFEQLSAQYRVPYALPGRVAFVGPNWRVDNFQQPYSISKLKTGSLYRYDAHLDVDGDGDLETIEDLPLYDLRLISTRDNGVIWLRSIPVTNDTYRLGVRALLERYVNSISGAGYARASMGRQGSMSTERRYAARVVSSEPITVGGRAAAAALLEVANVDQLQLDASSRIERVAVVITHARGRLRTRASGTFPVLLIAGYANSPAAFDASLADFQRFVGSIDI